MTETSQSDYAPVAAESPPTTQSAVPSRPPRRRRAGIIVLSAVNTLLLLALGGLVALFMDSARAWNADRDYMSRQVAEIVDEVAAAEEEISDLDAQSGEIGAKLAEVQGRDPAVSRCLAAVRKIIERLDAGERSIVLDYDDPCGVPLPGRWTING